MRLSRRKLLTGAATAFCCGGAEARSQEVARKQGQTMTLGLLGASDVPACQIAAAMAPGFAEVATREHGYAVDLRLQMVPFSELFGTIDKQFRAHADANHLIMAQSGWLDALAAAKWAMPINALIAQRPALEVPWFAPVVESDFQAFPSGSKNRWAMPLAGDALALFVRRDLLQRPEEAEAFQKRFGAPMPTSWDALASMTWDQWGKLLQFFTRPEQKLYGLGSPWGRDSDFVVSASSSFIYGAGGTLWRERGGQVEGVLDTAENAAALAQYRDLLRFQPPDALAYDAFAVASGFRQGALFSVLYWAGSGSSLITPDMEDKVLVVPPPSFPRPASDPVRPYAAGGQCWIVNDFNDEEHNAVAADFLEWWFRPETMLDFASRGGNPCDMATLSRPDFDLLQPWFRAYRAMLPRSRKLWRDPNFPELMAMQTDALQGYVAGSGDDAKSMLEQLACRQQKFLFKEGSAEAPAGTGCGTP